MRRTILFILLALSTFTIGFLTAGAPEGLSLALPAALITLILIKVVAGLTLHRLKVAVLTLLIWTPFAVGVLNVALPAGEGCVVDLPEEEIRADRDAAPPPVTFRYVTTARVMTLDRGCIDMQIYESGDGVKISTSTEEYESPEIAGRQLQRALGVDVKVLEREILFDGLGREVGERVLAARILEDKAYGFIYRTEGKKLKYIGGPSFSHALEFENYYRSTPGGF